MTLPRPWVWGATTQQTANTLAVHVNRLRRRFDGAGEKGRDWIRAVRGIGYQLTVPPPPDACDPG
jgi:DNA-binding response OmpR family regulator